MYAKQIQNVIDAMTHYSRSYNEAEKADLVNQIKTTFNSHPDIFKDRDCAAEMLIKSACLNCVPALKLILDHDVDVNATIDSSKMTALHHAVRIDSRESVELLLQRNAQFLPDTDKRTPLTIAITNRNYRLAIFLMNRGARYPGSHLNTLSSLERLDMLTGLSSEGNSLIQEAAIHGTAATLQALVEVGFDINAHEAQSPLHCAVSAGNFANVDFLLDQKAKQSPNAENMTPIALAVIKREVNIARIIIEKGVDVDINANVPVDCDMNNMQGIQNLLGLAIERSDPAMVAMLVEHGATMEVYSGIRTVHALNMAENFLHCYPIAGADPYYLQRKQIFDLLLSAIEKKINELISQEEGFSKAVAYLENIIGTHVYSGQLHHRLFDVYQRWVMALAKTSDQQNKIETVINQYIDKYFDAGSLFKAWYYQQTDQMIKAYECYLELRSSRSVHEGVHVHASLEIAEMILRGYICFEKRNQDPTAHEPEHKPTEEEVIKRAVQAYIFVCNYIDSSKDAREYFARIKRMLAGRNDSLIETDETKSAQPKWSKKACEYFLSYYGDGCHSNSMSIMLDMVKDLLQKEIEIEHWKGEVARLTTEKKVSKPEVSTQTPSAVDGNRFFLPVVPVDTNAGDGKARFTSGHSRNKSL